MNIYEIFNQIDLSHKIQTIFFIIAFIFMVFSMVGWVMELFFRRFVSQKKWINPGFLKGPYLPIYGIGTIILVGYSLVLSLIKEYISSNILFFIIIFIGMGLLMTIVELIGGLIFIKGMNLKLWDYSNRKLNYKGIICLEFSIIWAILGTIFYYLLFEPIVYLVIAFVKLDWFVLAVFLIGIFYGVFIIDLIQSLGIANKIKQLSRETDLVIKWESFKIHIKDKLISVKQKSSFISPFKSNISLSEHFKTFILDYKEKKNNNDR